MGLFQLWGPTASSMRCEHRMHLGLSCPNCPFSMELGNTGINTRIRVVLASRADPNFGPTRSP
jgi:hypothetical protein